MQFKNTEQNYGWVAIALHWLAGLTIIGMFALGYWMDGLDYYDSWYRQAPYIHKSVGILLLALMLFRIAWRWKNVHPKAEPSLSTFEIRASTWVHRILYALFFLLAVSGYLISTADGRAISVFGWFEVPATISNIDQQEDIAGEIHEILAWTLVVFFTLHVIGALKHHFIDKDRTLLRILGIRSK